MRNITVVMLIGALLALLSCTTVDPPHGDHGCEVVSTNNEWVFEQLLLHHNDSRSCPHDSSPGDTVTAGGTIEETDVCKDCFNQDIDALEMLVTIYNTNDGCNTEGANVGSDDAVFEWRDWDGDGNDDEWIAQQLVGFEAGTGYDPGRDCPRFTVRLKNRDTDAVAKTRIDYWDEQL